MNEEINRLCTACEGSGVLRIISGVYICKDCISDISAEIDRLRASKKPVNVLQIAKKHLRKTRNATTYLLRDLPEKTLHSLKQRALDEGTNVKAVMLKAVEAYLN